MQQPAYRRWCLQDADQEFRETLHDQQVSRPIFIIISVEKKVEHDKEG